MLRTPSRPWAVAALLLAAAAVFVACIQSTIAQQVVPADGGVYAEAVVGRPRFLNPLLAQPSSPDEDVTALVFSGLTRLTPSGEVVPDLAAGWEISPDGLVYDFRLRADVVWQDGQPFRAEDVLYTIQALQHPGFRGPAGLADFWRRVKAEKAGEARVRMTLDRPFAPFLEYAALGIAPAHLLGSVRPEDLPSHRFNADPVGTGPYRVTSAAPGQVSLEVNPRYHGRRPYLKEIRFVYYSSASRAADALRRGEVMGFQGVPPGGVSSLAALEGLTLHSRPDSATTTMLVLNSGHPLFADRIVRQAISYAVDRRRIAYSALGEQAAPAEGLVSPASWAFDPASCGRYEHRPERARELLEAAGWVLPPGEMIRQRNGQRLEFVILTNDEPERVRAAEEISRELEAVGMRATVQAAGWTGLVQDFLVPRRFQAVLTAHWSPTADPDLYAFWHSSQVKAGLSFGGWSNPTADTLLSQARETTDPKGRARLYSEFQALFAEEMPGVPLYYPLYPYAVSREVKGVHLGLLLRPSDRLDGIADWHVRTKRVPLSK